jgi:predicted DNA-binding transcriptional regulator AlpA
MAAIHNIPENLLNEHDVAKVTALSVASVRRWRLFRQGPKYLKIGAAVRYKPADVDAWLTSRPTGGSDVPPIAAISVGRAPVPTAANSRRAGNHNA